MSDRTISYVIVNTEEAD